MEKLVQHVKTENYNHPMLLLNAAKPVEYKSFEDSIEQFIVENETKFLNKDSGTVFCMIQLQNKNLFDFYLNITSKYVQNNKNLKTWGFKDKKPVIFISYK